MGDASEGTPRPPPPLIAGRPSGAAAEAADAARVPAGGAAPRLAARAVERALDSVGYLLFLFFFVVGQPLVRCLYRVRVEGRCRLRPGEPAIVAANHSSYADPIFVQLAVPRRILFLMTDVFYAIPWARWFFRILGCLPVAERGRPGNVATVRESARLLAAGRTLGIFPEGGLSPDGSLQRGRTGVARLMLQTGVRVLPVGIVGSFEVMSRPSPRLRFFRAITIRIGEPIAPPRRGDGDAMSRAEASALTGRIMSALSELTGLSLPADEESAAV